MSSYEIISNPLTTNALIITFYYCHLYNLMFSPTDWSIITGALSLFQVLSSFSLTRVKRPTLMESVFECDVQEGQVAPSSALRVSVCFTPLTVDCTSVDYFRLSCLGGISTAVLKVTGSCIGKINK